MADKQYVYAVARIRSKELSLLSGAFLEQLTAAKDYDECIQLLMEKGWGEDGMTNAADILAIEKRKTWELINELLILSWAVGRCHRRAGEGPLRVRRVPVRQRLPQSEGSHQGGPHG